MVPEISRDQLVSRLAEVSRLTSVRQESRERGIPLGELSLKVTDQDRERAEDAVAELERLGVYLPVAGASAEATRPSEDARPPEEEPPASIEPRRQRVTDIWGNPLGARRRRGR